MRVAQLLFLDVSCVIPHLTAWSVLRSTIFQEVAALVVCGRV